MVQTKPEAKKKASPFSMFCDGFFTWISGIVISAVPIFLKHLDIYLYDESIENYNFLTAILGDFDFSFISVSVLFILCLESLLLRDEVPKWHSKFRVCVMVCFAITGCTYCVAFFIRNRVPHALPFTQFGYNMLTLGLTIFFGLIGHIGIALREGGSVC